MIVLILILTKTTFPIRPQECFDQYPLVLADNPRSHQFYVPLDSPKITKFNYQVI